MSEEEFETQQSTMDAMLDAIQQANLSKSRAHFDFLMQDKISDALNAEKAHIASSIYNPQVEDEGLGDDLDLDMELDADEEMAADDSEEDWDENQVEAAFDEAELAQEELNELEP